MRRKGIETLMYMSVDSLPSSMFTRTSVTIAGECQFNDPRLNVGIMMGVSKQLQLLANYCSCPRTQLQL